MTNKLYNRLCNYISGLEKQDKHVQNLKFDAIAKFKRDYPNYPQDVILYDKFEITESPELTDDERQAIQDFKDLKDLNKKEINEIIIFLIQKAYASGYERIYK